MYNVSPPRGEIRARGFASALIGTLGELSARGQGGERNCELTEGEGRRIVEGWRMRARASKETSDPENGDGGSPIACVGATVFSEAPTS